jgi:hypothetical protein
MERRHKSEVVEVIRKTVQGFKDSPLKSFPGMLHTMFVQDDNTIVPAYMLTIRNNMGIPFIMPDWVHHEGLTKGSGFQDFNHDVVHMLQNNVDKNVESGRMTECWSELHKGGTPESRWRKGKLGDAGVLEGKTLIVCAPGPSLEALMPDVEYYRRENKDVVVMVINRAIRAIRGDYVLLIERYVPYDWQDDTALAVQKDATLLTTPQTDFKVNAAWPNDKMYWGYFNMGKFAQDERVNHLAIMDAMASTTIATAVRAGYEMGAAKIVLVGVDFGVSAVLEPARTPVPPGITEKMAEVLVNLSADVVNGDGRKEKAKQLAGIALSCEQNREMYGWAPSWRPKRFYFDQEFKDSPYTRDHRFSKWNAVQSTGRKPVLTTLEFISYAEQLRTVCAVIESGSDCRIINVSPDSVLQWRHMSLEDAIKWEAPSGNSE